MTTMRPPHRVRILPLLAPSVLALLAWMLVPLAISFVLVAYPPRLRMPARASVTP